MPSSRRPVLHLMNGIGDASITSIVFDQITHFGNAEYEWHTGGLKRVVSNEPFSELGAKVVDFSHDTKSQLIILQRLSRYVNEHGIQLVHCHTPRTTLTAAMALVRQPGVKLVTTRHSHAIPQGRRSFGWAFWSRVVSWQ